MFRNKIRSAGIGTSPLSSRRTAPRGPTSTPPIFRTTWLLTNSCCRSTSFTRTTLRPWTSIICWSSRSRLSRKVPSDSEPLGQSFIGVEECIPPLMLVIAAKASMRSPDLVLTTKAATRAESSWGCMATSRTRPLAPAESNTGAPNSSVRASFDI